MPATDECDVVAAPVRGRALAAAVRAAWDAGVAILPVDPAAPPAEQRRLLESLRPTHIVDAEGRRALAGGVPVSDDIVAIVVTSGTTGQPKGVELTRAGRDAMGRGYSAAVGATAADCWLACLPLHHVAGLGILARSYVTGVPVAVHDHFALDAVARAPRDDGATIVSLVPTVLRRLLDAGAPLHEFGLVVVGAAPCPYALRERAELADARVVDAYGMTETWGGWAIDGVPIDGARTALASDGEILVDGAMVMRRYRFDDAATQAAFTSDGWLRTGDVGDIVDGRVRVVDRKKDLVITGGVNVSPTEVENVLLQHPAVADVCVVGVRDDEWGERVVAYVVAAAADAPSLDALTLDGLRSFARERLSAAKMPRELRVVPEIPRSGSGKALRRLLTGDS